MKSGKYLELQWNTYSVAIRIPKDLQKYFGKSIFKKSLETSDFSEAEILKLPFIADWKNQIKAARATGKVGTSDLREKTEAAKELFKQIKATDADLAFTTVAATLEPKDLEDLSKPETRAAVKAFGEVTKNFTPTLDYIDAWVDQHGYAPAGADEAKNSLKKHFAKRFPFFETIEISELKIWLDDLRHGRTGQGPWSLRTVRKHYGFVKAYWSWCHERYTDAPNLAIQPGVAPSVPRTKSSRQATSNSTYKPFTMEEALLLQEKARDKNDQNLEDLITLGMYTGMRLGEICLMKVEEVGADRFTVTDSKTYNGLRDIPIHKDIQQMVERLLQTSTDGYLISGESMNNKHKDRTKGIGHRFGRLKEKLGFEKKRHAFHSLRATLANRFENAEVAEIFAARIIGHQVETMTYGIYSGQIDWEKAVESMAKVQYIRQ